LNGIEQLFNNKKKQVKQVPKNKVLNTTKQQTRRIFALHKLLIINGGKNNED